MNLKEIAEKAEGMDKNILDLIDIKTNQDMREVIAEIRNVESKLESKIESTNKDIKVAYWVIMVAGTIISVLLTILTLKK